MRLLDTFSQLIPFVPNDSKEMLRIDLSLYASSFFVSYDGSNYIQNNLNQTNYDNFKKCEYFEIKSGWVEYGQATIINNNIICKYHSGFYNPNTNFFKLVDNTSTSISKNNSYKMHSSMIQKQYINAPNNFVLFASKNDPNPTPINLSFYWNLNLYL
jgi:hypothetical protein